MKSDKSIRIWLIVGLVMIFFQIVIGGITRLTGSGLSITRWEIVTGTLPPLNETDWKAEFELYKQTPQYEKINEGMSLGSFKFIYFWEYFHRLWARLMGFVFLIPFLIFTATRRLRGALLKQTVILFFLAALVASFGWIMVASGLVDRPWVNTYKLTLHLSLALLTFIYLWFVYYNARGLESVMAGLRQKRFLLVLFILVCVQIMLGGIVSGSKAALAYPTWPDMNGAAIPPILFEGSAWNLDAFVHYDKNSLFPALVQLLHRTLAYFLVLGIGFWVYWSRDIGGRPWKISGILLAIVVFLQVLLGILTLWNSIGEIPLWLGVAHQGVGILLLSVIFYQLYRVYFASRNMIR